ncbi:glycosyltransferase family 2 protein [Bacteroides thetaiotaomicron]|nr:glycosyltransferase family 2 protein [Bacteroides thetaiotaomicron]
MVTVFTPTYNRAYILNDLYQSLCRQTCRKFEWLIVDDGSTDNTEGLVASWLDEGKMSLRYIKQPNGGKHRAINKGIQEANGDLFFIVDSDDYLAKNAIERILFFMDLSKTIISLLVYQEFVHILRENVLVASYHLIYWRQVLWN